MVADLVALPVFAWLLTYALHSALLLGLAWLLTRRIDARALRLRERIWKLAVVGGFVSASLQTGLGVQPLFGQLALGVEGETYVAVA